MSVTYANNRGKVPSAWDAEGGSLLDAAAAMLRAEGYDAFTEPPSVAACAEPVVLRLGAWERESRQTDGSERGVRELQAFVCAEDKSDALAMCGLVASVLAEDEWPQASGWRWRVVAVDVASTDDEGRDGSGRWVYALTLRVTLVHEPKAAAS